MTVSSGVIEPFLEWSADAVDVPLLNGLRIQILPTFNDLYQARRHQYAAFIASEALLVVWDDEPTHLLQRAKSIEAELLKFVWFKSTTAAQDEKALMESSEHEVDEETGLMANKERPILLYNCFLVGCSLCLLTVLIGLGYVKIADEVSELHEWISLVFLVMTPVNAFLTLVSSLNLFCCRESYHRLILMKLFALVFLFRHHQRHRPNYWTNPASYQELQIFLRYPASTSPNEDSTTHHHPMPSIQGEPGVGHPTDSAINQKGHLHLRTPRRFR
jgi:hypothetical protein